MLATEQRAEFFDFLRRLLKCGSLDPCSELARVCRKEESLQNKVRAFSDYVAAHGDAFVRGETHLIWLNGKLPVATRMTVEDEWGDSFTVTCRPFYHFTFDYIVP